MEEKGENRRQNTTSRLFSEEIQRLIRQAKREFPLGTRLPDHSAAQIIDGILEDLKGEQKGGETGMITTAQNQSGNSGKVVPMPNPSAKKRAA